jgi:hypothetical protein
MQGVHVVLASKSPRRREVKEKTDFVVYSSFMQHDFCLWKLAIYYFVTTIAPFSCRNPMHSVSPPMHVFHARSRTLRSSN